MKTVQTVTGPVSVDELGITLMHEHLILDNDAMWEKPSSPELAALSEKPLGMEMLGELRYQPFFNRDNLRLIDVDEASAEVQLFRGLGGKTIVELTSAFNGRNPAGLREIALRTGVAIIMSSGYYLEHTYTPALKGMGVEALADNLVQELTVGVDGTGIRAGIIGEAGISKDMTGLEVRMLRAQARAHVRTGIPLTIHTHGWGRQCHRILDVVAEEGADLRAVILDHMNPSLHDLDYQKSLLSRGVYIEYDMIGMDYYYPHVDGQSPSDPENAAAIRQLIQEGFLRQLLLSHDVWLKMMWVRYGGFGYGHILRHFVPRLARLGVSAQQIDVLLRQNPREVFAGERRQAA
jgi:phosphotriesterase-related protein